MVNYPTCVICGKQNTRLKYKMPRFDLYSCRNCHHLFSDVKGNFEPYNKDYYFNRLKEYFNKPDLDLFNTLEKLVSKYWDNSKGLRWLDVGTGIGLLPKHFGALGYETWGIDTSSDSIEFGSQHLNISRLQASPIEDFDVGCSFHVITCINVIEHVNDPLFLLHHIQRLLDKNGIFVCTTVNSGSLIFSIAKIIYNMSAGLFLTPLQRLCEVHHLQHYCKKSFELALQRSGLVIENHFGRNLPIELIVLTPIEKFLTAACFLISNIINSHFLQGVVCKKGALL